MPSISGAVGNISGAVSDLFLAESDRSKASFDLTEGQEYGLASDLALQNKQFTEMSTSIKEAQISRDVSKSLGLTQAQEAGAGFATSGSGLDILRESTSQGALTKAVASENGLVQEAGYQERADSYKLMQAAATQAADAETNAAKGADINAIIKLAAANWAG